MTARTKARPRTNAAVERAMETIALEGLVMRMVLTLASTEREYAYSVADWAVDNNEESRTKMNRLARKSDRQYKAVRRLVNALAGRAR